jgi:uridine kinase
MNKTFFRKYLYTKLGESKLSILCSPLFLSGLVLKIIASFSFASDYFTGLFIPFLKYYTLSGFQDPYAHFLSLGITNAFPYPRAMLYIMSLPGIIFQHFLNPDIFFITNFEIGIYRLPIIFADCVILIILSRWIKGKDVQILWLYWLSPILFYINYFQGQLDVIPIALVFISLYFLFKERYLLSYLFLGVAVSAKIHILILLPFIATYLRRKQKRLQELFIFFDILFLVFLALNFSGLFQPGFQKMVFGNSEQFKIFSAQLKFFDGSIIYLVPFAYILLFFYNLTFRSFNRDVFIMFLGFGFGILLLLIPPMPGWYYWIIPFLVYFYAKNEKFSKVGFAALNFGYFLYFILIPKSDFLNTLRLGGNIPNAYGWLTEKGINANIASDISFSFLQAILFLNVLWIYHRGVESGMKNKLYSMPYLIGVAGDSGSGKTTFALSLRRIFGNKNIAIVAGDDMHKWERGNPLWQKFTHLHPKANNLHDDMESALSLKSGDTVYRRRYDHGSGKFTLPMKLESKKVIIFEGLHSFFLGQMREALDLKIFIMPEESLRVEWKLFRDMNERGHARERVLEQIKNRADDSEKFIRTQEKYSDITISLRKKNDNKNNAGENINSDIYLEIKCKNNVNFENFTGALPSSVSVQTSFSEQWQYFYFCGKITGGDIEKLSYALVPEMYEITTTQPKWEDGYGGIVQLFVCYYIFGSLRINTYVR